MAAMSHGAVRTLIANRAVTPENAFEVLAALGRISCLEDRDHARELLIRVLDQREQIPDSLSPLLQSLVREHGLFPPHRPRVP